MNLNYVNSTAVARYYLNPNVIDDYFPSTPSSKKVEKVATSCLKVIPRVAYGLDMKNLTKIGSGSSSTVSLGPLYNLNDSACRWGVIKEALTHEVHHLFFSEYQAYQLLRRGKVRHIVSLVHLVEDALTKDDHRIPMAMILDYKGFSLSCFKSQCIPFPLTHTIMKQTLETLEDCARLKLIHCDLKGENILVMNGNITVVDWANATFVGNPISQSRTTYMYQAPEAFLNERNDLPYPLERVEKYTGAIDIWSLGCIFYEITVGELPFATSYDQMLNRIA